MDGAASLRARHWERVVTAAARIAGIAARLRAEPGPITRTEADGRTRARVRYACGLGLRHPSHAHAVACRKRWSERAAAAEAREESE